MYSNKLLNEVKVQELFDDALLTDSPEEQVKLMTGLLVS